MKKYEYKTFSVAHETYTDITLLLNKYGLEGWRVLDISWSDGGNLLTVILEREIL